MKLIGWKISLIGILLVNLVCGCDKTPKNGGPKKSGDNGYRLVIANDQSGYEPNKIYNIYLVGSRDFSNLQLFSHFVITAEALSENNEIEFAGPKRVGRFMLYSDSLTKFADHCINTVVESDDLPKSEIQVMWQAPRNKTGCVRISAMVYEGPNSWFADDGELTKIICDEKPDPKRKLNEDECCACDEAKYNFVFEGIWSNETHPKDFPFAIWLTHFSDIIGASHDANFSFWGKNHLATDGFRSLAEWGSPRLLETELRARGGRLKTLIKAGGLWFPNVNDNTSSHFRVDRKHNKVSLVSMFGPSPDWVVGISGLDLCRKDCTWEESLDIDLYPWDAGTDNGISYMSANEATLPQEKMYKITTKYPEDPRAPFYNMYSDMMTPLAKLYLRRNKVIPKNCDEEVLQSQILEVAENDDEDVAPECEVTQFSSWSSCSVTCGKGLRMRTRSYKYPQRAQESKCSRQLIFKEMCVAAVPECEGTDNDSDSSENLENTDSLVSEGGEGQGVCETTHWSMWSECSATCGIGITMRTRTFVDHRGRKKCTHIPTVEKQKCMQPECSFADIEAPDPECPVSSWSDYSPCSSTCGKGSQIRTRLLLVEPEKEEMCKKRIELHQQRQCELRQQCLFNPEEAREVCTSPMDPGQCRGSFKRYYYDASQQTCNEFDYNGCRGNRNNFLTVDDCLKSCSVIRSAPTTSRPSPPVTIRPTQRVQPRTRPTTRQPTPQPFYERERVFDRHQFNRQQTTYDSQNRYTHHRHEEIPTTPPPMIYHQPNHGESNLPVDCVLTDWSDWSACSVTCGVGRQEKIREIVTESENGGLPCPKKLFKRRRCALSSCPY